MHARMHTRNFVHGTRARVPVRNAGFGTGFGTAALKPALHLFHCSRTKSAAPEVKNPLAHAHACLQDAQVSLSLSLSLSLCLLAGY